MNSPSTPMPSWPAPVCITLYNLMTNQIETEQLADEEEALSKTWFRPAYESRLLAEMRLEIVVEQELVVYRGDQNRVTIHPSWDLLDERIEMFKEENYNELYESMRAKIISFDEVICEIALHPKQLRRIPNHRNVNEYNNMIKDADSNVLPNKGPMPPWSLPPNAILVLYDDGTIRVPYDLYDVLWSQYKFENLTTPVVERSMSMDDSLAEEMLLLPRFDDDVFEELNHGEVHVPARTSQNDSPSALLGSENDDPKPTGSLNAKMTSAELTPDAIQRHTSLLDTDQRDGLDVALPTELDARIKELVQEAQELEKQIQREQDALNEDSILQLKIQGELKSVMKEVRVAQDEAEEILNEARSQEKLCAQVEFLLESQRVRLVQQLQMIYPIQCFANQTRHCIRGLELPFTIIGSTVSDEEVSAALGYVCHVVTILSKYLQIPLSYRIVCNSSRSAIQLNQNTMVPLFGARMVERAQLESGVELLERNVDCLLRARNLPATKSHMLAKLEQLYESITT